MKCALQTIFFKKKDVIIATDFTTATAARMDILNPELSLRFLKKSKPASPPVDLSSNDLPLFACQCALFLWITWLLYRHCKNADLHVADIIDKPKHCKISFLKTARLGLLLLRTVSTATRSTKSNIRLTFISYRISHRALPSTR